MSTDAVIPDPPRYWWLKRLAVAYVLLAAGTVALRYGWYRAARGRVAGQIAAWRAAGQPVLAADFASPRVDDPENAAVLLRAAAQSINSVRHTDEERDVLNSLLPGAPTPAQIVVLEKLVKARRAGLDLARRARSLPKLDWGLNFDKSLWDMSLPGLNDARTVFDLSQSACAVAHARGDDREAVELCRDMLFTSRAASGQPFLISSLVSTSLSIGTAQSVWQIAPTLEAKDPATRQAALALIAELLDDQHIRDCAVRAAYCERAMEMDVARHIGVDMFWRNNMEEPMAERFVGWWYRPIVEDDLLQMMRRTTDAARAAGAADAPASRRISKARPVKAESPNDALLYPLSRSMAPIIDPAIVRSYSAQRDRRAAAIDLAVRLYQIDHEKLPARVEDLVPTYLKEAPIDPTTGAPLTRSIGSAATTRASPQ
jgi:hypothetical protein